MNPLLVRNFAAGAAIGANRFVKFGADDAHVIQAAAETDGIIGASGKIAAAAAEDRTDIMLVGVALIKLGTGGITRGAKITADATGQGVATTVNTTRVGGIALAAGVAGDLVPVLLSPT